MLYFQWVLFVSAALHDTMIQHTQDPDPSVRKREEGWEREH